MVGFPRDLLPRLRGRVIVIWDGGSNHKGPSIRELPRKFPRLHLERLPGYAPDLNLVEMIWAYLKHVRLANFVPRQLKHLDRVVVEHLRSYGASRPRSGRSGRARDCRSLTRTLQHERQ